MQQILSASTNNTQGMDRLSYMCDTFGSRLSGSEGLEEAIDWIAAEMQADQLQNVQKEPVVRVT